MDSNFQKCTFLASFPLTSAHVLVALLVIKVSSMVLYPFLRFWTTGPAKAHFPRNLDVKSANNSGTTQVKRPYLITACSCAHGPRIPRSVRTLYTRFLPMRQVHISNQQD